MILALDVHYDGAVSRSAGVMVSDFAAGTPSATYIHETTVEAEDYVPGEFYKRELPLLLAILDQIDVSLCHIIVDGYVWLGDNKPGLGAHLHSAIGETTPVIGVAKNRFRGDDWSYPILRGQSDRPVYLTSAGIAIQSAAAQVQSMHGGFRIPTLLKKVDQLARGAS